MHTVPEKSASERPVPRQVRNRLRFVLISMILLAVMVVGIPTVDATSRMDPQKPFPSSWGMKGKTYRNNGCGGAVCSNERVQLYRSSWSGYRYVKGSSRVPRSESTAYTYRACRSGTYTYQTVHKQTMRVASDSVPWRLIPHNVRVESRYTRRAYRNSENCENGRK